MIESISRLIDLTVWGVMGNDFRAWGMIWERKLNKLADKFMISEPKDISLLGLVNQLNNLLDQFDTSVNLVNL